MKTGDCAFAAIMAIVVFGFVFIGCSDGDEDAVAVSVTPSVPADPRDVASVIVSPTTLNLDAGKTAQLTPTVLPVTATNRTVSFSSDDENIATVSSIGLVTAKAAGTTNINVTSNADSTRKAICIVNVNPVILTGVTLAPATFSLAAGTTRTLSATVLPANASNKNVTWSSANDLVATVSGGTVSAVAVGITTITVTTAGLKADGQHATASCTVNVTAAIAVTGVTLDKSTLSLTVGYDGFFTPTVSPANASNKNVTWSSGNNLVATVNNGIVSAVAVGTATITVTTAGLKADSQPATATCTVTVYAPMPGIEGMVWINPGTFMMGSPANEPERSDDETRHQVTLTKGFYMGETAVMLGEYYQLTRDIPTWFYDDYYDYYYEFMDLFPIDGITWYDALEYCNKLSEKEGLTPVYTITDRVPAATAVYPYPISSANITVNWDADGYRLPTEAEWEYACRAGTTTPFNTGDNILPPGYMDAGEANYFGAEYPYNGADPGGSIGCPWPGYAYEPNAWGLYAMHGNLEEWCWDRYAANYGGTGPQTDPKGPATGNERVVRGGSWADIARYIRSASRYHYEPDEDLDGYVGLPYVGFRVVRNAPAGAPSGSRAVAKYSVGEQSKIEKIQKARIVPRSMRFFDKASGVKPQGVRGKRSLYVFLLTE
jgi:uncharacterized protein YjdB